MIQNPAIQGGGGVQHEAISLASYPEINARNDAFRIKIEKGRMNIGCMILVAFNETVTGATKIILWYEPDGSNHWLNMDDTPVSTAGDEDANAYYLYLMSPIEGALGYIANVYYAYI